MSIKDLMVYGVLADATYGTFDFTIEKGVKKYADAPIEKELVSRRKFSEEQAKDFTKTYTVLDQGFDSNGFASTIFQNKASKEIIFVPRGTEADSYKELEDIVEDLVAIGGQGVAANQATSLFNYLLMANARAGESVDQYSYHIVITYKDEEPIQNVIFESSVVTAPLDGVLLGKGFSIAGHSLGGHLGIMLSRLAGDQAKDVFAFNAPGFDFSSIPGEESYYAALKQAEILNTGSTFIQENYNLNLITNTIIDLDFIHKIGTQHGDAVSIYDEPIDPYNTHLIGQMTESLMVQSLFEKISIGINTVSLTNILEASSEVRKTTLEKALSGLVALFVGNDLEAHTIAKTDDRTDFYRIYKAIDTALDKWFPGELSSAKIESLFNRSAEQLTLAIRDDIAYKYAAFQANAYAVEDAEKLYTTSEISEKLKSYDPTTGLGSITESWINDRAKFLAYSLKSNQEDKTNLSDPGNANAIFLNVNGMQGQTVITVNDPSTASRTIFSGPDGGSVVGDSASDSLYGGNGIDQLNGGGGNDYIEGGLGADLLIGGEGTDTLVGMLGNDRLQGGVDSDFLFGGLGQDTYYFSNGDGADVIADIDLLGQIVINNTPLSYAEENAPGSNTWTAAPGINLTLTEAGNLIISYGSGDSITIQNYRGGGLGIQLENYRGETINPDLTIYGDLKPTNDDPVHYEYDSLGNVVVFSNVIEVYREDVLYGSELNDKIVGRGGSDQLFGKAGDDYLYANLAITLTDALSAEEDNLGTRGDWVDGGAGVDTLIGSQASDVMLGGDDGDYIAGGAGDDYILSDESTVFVAPNWEYTIQREPFVRTQLIHSNSVADGEGGDDIVFGQGGNDVIFGGKGNDRLDGGVGDDELIGQEGNDTLIGGGGDDGLVGDDVDYENTDPYWEGGLASIYHGDDILDGGAGNDSLNGNGGNDVLYGGLGNDVLSGDDAIFTGISGDAYKYFGKDVLDGGDGNDLLYGGGNDDLLRGGTGDDEIHGDYLSNPLEYHGNDILYGEAGNDRMWGMGGEDQLSGGDGDDYIDGDNDTLPLITNGNDLINGGAGNDTIFGGYGDDVIYGDDGDDIISGDYVAELEVAGNNTIHGGNGNDSIYAGNGRNIIYGDAGNDYIKGGNVGNYFNGGEGLDYIESGIGNDIYEVSLGSQIDIIKDGGGTNQLIFDASFSFNSITVDLTSTDFGLGLRISNGGNDSAILVDYNKWTASSFRFAGGKEVSYSDIIAKLSKSQTDLNDAIPVGSIGGTLNNESISGDDGDNVLIGFGGNDLLEGGSGNDKYIFFKDDGSDFIKDQRGFNVVSFGGDITKEDVEFSVEYAPDGEHLLKVAYPGGEIKIEGGLYGSVSRFDFSNGVTLTIAEANALLPSLSILNRESGGTLYGSDNNDQLYGQAGDDIIHAQSGNDLVEGDDGNDFLLGEGGNDQLYGGSGNDHLLGGDGDDLLSGGAGTDILEGGAGSNVYAFELGMQTDRVVSSEGSTNSLQFSSVISINDLVATRSADDLVILRKYGSETMILTDYYASSVSWEAKIADLGVLSMQDFVARLSTNTFSINTAIEREFITSVQDSVSVDRLAYGYQPTLDGTWARSSSSENSAGTNFSFFTYSDKFTSGTASTTPNWLSYMDGTSVVSEHDYVTSERSEQVKVASSFNGVSGLAYTYIPMNRYDGFSYNLTDTIIPAYNKTGWLTGYYILPASSGSSSPSVTETQTHTTIVESVSRLIVDGQDQGGRVNLESGNIYRGGAGNDTVVTYINNSARYSHADHKDPFGVVISAGGGNDTLVGSDGQDYLIGGTGVDVLYGGNEEDTYVIDVNATLTVVADILIPRYDSPPLRSVSALGLDRGEWKIPGYWEPTDYQDTVVLPEGITLNNITLSWGEAVIESTHLELWSGGSTAPVARSMYKTLDLSWGGEVRVSVVIPTDRDFQGSGVEFVKFHSGEQLELDELIKYFSLPPTESLEDTGVIFESITSYFDLRDQREVPFVGTFSNDTLSGSGILMGAGGNDLLTGGSADTKYIYNLGDGKDTIILGETNNTLDLTGSVGRNGVWSSELRLVKKEDDLLVKFTSNGGNLTIKNYFSDQKPSDSHLQILTKDGITLNDQDIIAQIVPDELGPLILNGTFSDDILQGGEGNDMLLAMFGSDRLLGEQGSDIYSYGAGSGVQATVEDTGGTDDVFIETSGIGKTDYFAHMAILGNDLVYTPTIFDSVTFKGFFGDRDNVIEHFVFNFSETITAADVYRNFGLQFPTEEPVSNGLAVTGTSYPEYLFGFDGNDTLKGAQGDDFLVGLGGNDLLVGGTGRDTYLFSGNFGNDVIEKGSSSQEHDTINFYNTSRDAIWFSKTGDNLNINIVGTTNKVTIVDWASSIDTIGAEFWMITQPGIETLVGVMENIGGYHEGMILSSQQQEALNRAIADTWM